MPEFATKNRDTNNIRLKPNFSPKNYLENTGKSNEE